MKPYIKNWAFVRMSDGALYTKTRIVKSIIKETMQKGSFDANRIECGLGIVGYEGAKGYDKSQINIRNRVLRLRADRDKIVVITANYNEYFIQQSDMRSWFEIFKEARDHAKVASAEAELARIAAEEAEKRQLAAEQKVPSETEVETALDNQYQVPEQFRQMIWAM